MINKKISILLIEDNKLVQKITALILGQLNCKVRATSSSILALELLHQQTFDLIFADVNLPDMDGFTLIKKIRENPFSNQQVPIIMLSAHSDEKTIKNCFAAGATDFLVKPLNQTIAQDIFSKYLGGY